MHILRPILRAAEILALGALLFLLLPAATYAATVYTQDAQNVLSNSAGAYFQQQLGTGLSGTIESFAFKIHSAAFTADTSQFSTGNYYLAFVYECPDSTYANCSNTGLHFDPYSGYAGGLGAWTSLGGDDYIFRFNDIDFSGTPQQGSYTLNSTRYYYVVIAVQSTDKIYGGTAQYNSLDFRQYTGGVAWAPAVFPYTPNGTLDSNISEMAFRFCDTATCDLATADTQAPILGIISTSTASSLPTITGTTTDTTDVELILNSKTYTFTPSAGTWFITLPPGDELSDGTYTLTASSTDAAGNTGMTTGSLLVDTTAPTLSIDSGPLAGATISTSTATFTFTASDAHLSSTVCAWDGVATSSCSSPVSSILADGAHSFTVVASDSLGNSTTLSRSFSVNTTPPPPNSPTDKDQCKKGGWKTFTNPSFKNQGDCVSFVEKHEHDKNNKENIDREDKDGKSSDNKNHLGRRPAKVGLKLLSFVF